MEQTVFHDWHRAHHGRMVDFAGWSMPVQYSSIVEEHQAVRQRAGLFDISHMGRLQFIGGGAEALLDRLLTRRVTGLKPGQIRYSLMTNERGGILDDVLVYHLGEWPAFKTVYQLVVNASNREKIVGWIEQHLGQAGGQSDVEMIDVTRETAMIAVQGPRAIEIAQPLSSARIGELAYYTCTATEVLGHTVGNIAAGVIALLIAAMWLVIPVSWRRSHSA